MDILLMMWFVIDMVLLLILPFRKTVTKYENVMRRRSIESVKSLGARLMDVLSKIFLLIPVGLIVYILIHIVPDMIIQKLLEWYKGIFIVALFPLLFATVYKGNIIKNLIMDCQSYTKYRPNETTGGIFVSWRRKEELPTGA